MYSRAISAALKRLFSNNKSINSKKIWSLSFGFIFWSVVETVFQSTISTWYSIAYVLKFFGALFFGWSWFNSLILFTLAMAKCFLERPGLPVALYMKPISRFAYMCSQSCSNMEWRCWYASLFLPFCRFMAPIIKSNLESRPTIPIYLCIRSSAFSVIS